MGASRGIAPVQKSRRHLANRPSYSTFPENLDLGKFRKFVKSYFISPNKPGGRVGESRAIVPASKNPRHLANRPSRSTFSEKTVPLLRFGPFFQKSVYFAKQTNQSGGDGPGDRSQVNFRARFREPAELFDFLKNLRFEIFANFSFFFPDRATNRAVGRGRSRGSLPGGVWGPVSRSGRIRIFLNKKFKRFFKQKPRVASTGRPGGGLATHRAQTCVPSLEPVRTKRPNYSIFLFFSEKKNSKKK